MADILLAEDDEAMLNFLVIALERAGHTVLATKDGADALTALNGERHFDLLLTDVVMPGLDGIELAQKATEKRPFIKVLFITGFAAMALQIEKEKVVENAEKATLSKPFHLNDLVEQVEQILAG